MYMQVQKKLFTPVQIGPITLKHRIVMPPMSRLRAQWPSGIPSDLMREYYSQRASDGALILTEATAISPSGRGYRGAPCLYRDEQVTGWKRITDAVHAKGGYMLAQLWHAGRTTHVAVTGEQPVTASVDPAYCADPNIFVVTPTAFRDRRRIERWRRPRSLLSSGSTVPPPSTRSVQASTASKSWPPMVI